MECMKCGVEKLSKEFPPVPPSKECNHPLFTCLKCVVEASKSDKKECPYEDCKSPISDQSSEIELFKAILDTLFQKYEAEYTKETQLNLGKDGFLTVCTLDGTTLNFEYNANMSIFELKEKLQKELGCEVKYQKLVYNSRTLDNFSTGGQQATLKHYKIPPDSQIYFVKLLCELPSFIKEVVFDIEWGYPTSQETFFFGFFSFTKHHKDYLDASCVIFTKESCTPHIVNVRQRYYEGIEHDLEYIDGKTKRGHHTIKVRLPEVNQNAKYLFFTLSARGDNRKIYQYTQPVLKVYDETHEERHQLCSTSLKNVDHEQAIIVCCVHRAEDAVWRVSNIREPSEGNRDNYDPMIKKMREMIIKRTI